MDCGNIGRRRGKLIEPRRDILTCRLACGQKAIGHIDQGRHQQDQRGTCGAFDARTAAPAGQNVVDRQAHRDKHVDVRDIAIGGQSVDAVRNIRREQLALPGALLIGLVNRRCILRAAVKARLKWKPHDGDTVLAHDADHAAGADVEIGVELQEIVDRDAGFHRAEELAVRRLDPTRHDDDRAVLAGAALPHRGRRQHDVRPVT